MAGDQEGVSELQNEWIRSLAGKGTTRAFVAARQFCKTNPISFKSKIGNPKLRISNLKSLIGKGEINVN